MQLRNSTTSSPFSRIVVLQTKEKTVYSGIEELLAIDRSMPRYNSFIAETITRSLKPGTRPVDFGAGIGTLSDLIVAKTGIKPTCVEVDPTCRQVLQSKGYRTFDNIADAGKFDFVFSSNVLEHIENDQEILKLIFNSLEKDGQIVLYLPAFQILFSKLDASVGHYRRYDKKALVSKLGTSNNLASKRYLWFVRLQRQWNKLKGLHKEDFWLIVADLGAKMKRKSGPEKEPADKVIKDIRRVNRRRF